MRQNWDDQLTSPLEKGWEAVAAYLKKTEPTCYRYCPICRQGLVQARGITLHFKAYHPWASAALQQARHHTSSHRHSLILCSPCRYCGQVFRSHHTKHAAECPMIIYAKTLHNLRTSTALQEQHPVLQQPSDGSRGDLQGRSLGSSSRAPASADPGSSGSRVCDGHAPDPPDPASVGAGPPSDAGGSSHAISSLHRGHADQNNGRPSSSPDQVHTPGRERTRWQEGSGSDTEATARQSRPGTGATPPIPATKSESATGGTARLRQSTLAQAGFGVVGGKDGATHVASRRFPHRTCSVDLVGPLRGDCASPVHDSSPGTDSSRMASHETRHARIHTPAVEDHIVPNVGCRIEGSLGIHHQRPSLQAASPGSTGHGGTRSVPLQKVECCPPCPREHPESGSFDSQGGSHPPQRGDHSGDPGGSAGELSCKSSSPRGDGGAHGHIHIGAGAPRAEGIQNVEHPGDPAKQCIPHVGRDDIAKGKTSEITVGPVSCTRGPTAAPGLPIIRAKLLNLGNECYANSVLLATLWTSTLHSPTEASMRQPLHDDLQALLTSTTPQHVWSRPVIKRCLRQWPHNGRQQDAADFLQHWSQAAQLVHFQSSWSILTAGSLRDCGSVTPLVLQCDLQELPLVRGTCPLQSIVRSWQAVTSQPALHAGTTCVALQLNRFVVRDRAVHKLSTPVSLPNKIYLPCWVEGSLTQREFLLSAALVHLGSTPHSGHYRALLVEGTGKMWWTDDGVPARPPRKDEAATLLRNVYIVFLRPSQHQH